MVEKSIIPAVSTTPIPTSKKYTYLLVKILTCTLSLISALTVYGNDESVVWRDFPELYSQEVIDIAKDTSGCLWLGTANGLGRYDGYSLELFKTGRDCRVLSLDIDSDQNIWFGTMQGAYVLKPDSNKSVPVDSSRIHWKQVPNIHATPDGNIWIVQRGYLRRYDKNGNWKRDYAITDRSGNPTTLSGFCYSREKEIFITTFSPIVYKYNPEKDSFFPIANLGIDTALGKIIEDFREKYFWIADHTGNIYRFNPDAGQGTQFITSKVVSPDEPGRTISVHDMAQDITNGNIWVAGRTCLVLFTKDSEGHLVPAYHKMNPALKGTLVESIKASDEGIWMSTFGYKTMLLPYKHNTVNHTLFGFDENQTREPLITSIQEDSTPGYYWVVQNRHGLILYNSKTGAVQNHTLLTNESLRLHVASEVIPSQKHNGIWVLLERSMNAHRLENDNGQIRFCQTINPGAQVPSEATATTAFEDNTGNLWIGSTDGAYRYNPTNGNMNAAAAPGCYITDIVQGNDNDIWLSTRSRGLIQITPEGKTISHTKMTHGIIALAAAPNSWLWYASDNGKVIGFNHLTGEIEDLSESLPLNGAEISDIAADQFGHIWIKTPRTLTEYNPRNQEYRTHDVSHIKTPVEVFLSKFTHGENGTLVIGGIGGAEVFHPSNSLDRQNSRIQVSLTDITSAGKELLPGSRTVKSSDNEIQLQASLRNINISFSTLNYKHVSKVRYAYRMYPYEQQWNYTREGENKAFYNQIPHGKYQFQIRATDENGVMSDSCSTFLFNFKPAFYQTWWAYLIYALAAALAIFFLVRYNLKIQSRKNERMWNESSEMMKMRNYLEAPAPTQLPEFEELDKALFNKGVSVIEANLSDPDFGVDSFAKAMNMSRSTLSRKLKIIYGGTPLDLIRDIRMRHAKSLLSNPNLNVSDVAEAVGFPDRRYFSSSFKKAIGMSPSDYQRRLRGINETGSETNTAKDN